MVFFTANPTPPCPFFPPFSPPHSQLQYTRQSASIKAVCLLRRVSCSPTTSHPSRLCTLKTSLARPTPSVLNTTIIWTLCVATLISLSRRTCSIPCFFCHTKRRFALPRRLRFRVNNFLFFLWLVPSCNYFPYSRSCLLILSCGVGSTVPPRVISPIFRSRGEPGAQPRSPLLPPAFRGGTPVLVLWRLLRTVWLVDSTGSSPPTPLNAPLAGHITLAVFR